MAKKKKEHITFDQMCKIKNIPFSKINKETTKKKKKK